MAEEDPGSSLGLTKPRELVGAAIAGAVGAYLLVLSIERITGQPPLLPWVGPLVLFFVAALVGGLAWTTHRRIQVRREYVEPQQAVTFLVFGKASALGGAAITAGYLIFALMWLGNVQAEGPQQRLVRGLVAALAGVGMGVAGLLLERACKVPDPPEDAEDE